jgi:hypothetical protein
MIPKKQLHSYRLHPGFQKSEYKQIQERNMYRLKYITKLDNEKNSQLSYNPQPIIGNEGPTLKLGENEMTEKTRRTRIPERNRKKEYGGQLIHYRNFTV